MLILKRKCDQSIMIDDNICITVMEIYRDHVKLGVRAPNSVKVFREEVYQAIVDENRAAASSSANLKNVSGIIEDPS